MNKLNRLQQMNFFSQTPVPLCRSSLDPKGRHARAADSRPWTLGSAALARARASPFKGSSARAPMRSSPEFTIKSPKKETPGLWPGRSPKPHPPKACAGEKQPLSLAEKASGWGQSPRKVAGAGGRPGGRAAGKPTAGGRLGQEVRDCRPPIICLYNNYITTI